MSLFYSWSTSIFVDYITVLYFVDYITVLYLVNYITVLYFVDYITVVFCRLHNSAVPVSISSGAESVSVLLFIRNGMLHTHATSTHQATNIRNVIT